jgi:hypothetical protein
MTDISAYHFHVNLLIFMIKKVKDEDIPVTSRGGP